MRLVWGLCCRRRHIVRKSLALFMSIVVVCWIIIFVLQNAQENASHSTQQQGHNSYGQTVEVNPIHNGKSSQPVNKPNRNTSRDTKNSKNTPRVLMNTNNARLPKSLAVDINKNTSVQSRNNSNIQAQNTTRHSLSTSHVNKPNIASLDLIPSQTGPDSLRLLQQNLRKRNREQRVLNADKFPPLSDTDLVLVVQVHKRMEYLQLLLNSLRDANGIENVLLVISHDYFYDEMNKLVEGIQFCKVIQIFYPFSMQVLPDNFPGTSKNDCPRDATKKEAIQMNCTNAHHPDSFGHYREAKVTAIKHHWWWKINTVFDGLSVTANYSGYVLFLEEDHYVSPDFIYMTKKLIELKKSSCHDCDFINLGMYNKVKSYNGLSQKVSIGVWNAGKNNMGFGMDRGTWHTVRGCSKHFCTYDDYNWDWSLNVVGSVCLNRNFKVLVLKAPRILHIGTCGTHHHRSCNEKQQERDAKYKLNAEKNYLFPSSLTIDPGTNPAPPRKKIKNYGGWGDIRDHNLCLSFVHQS